MEKHSIRQILCDSGADEAAIERFDAAYEEIIGEEAQPLLAENIAEPKKLSIQSEQLRIDIKPESAELIETRVIDGREYFLIPVTEQVTVNGIRLRRKGNTKQDV